MRVYNYFSLSTFYFLELEHAGELGIIILARKAQQFQYVLIIARTELNINEKQLLELQYFIPKRPPSKLRLIGSDSVGKETWKQV